MPKPRDITDAAIATVVFTFLKKALNKFTGDQPEGKKKISKKASIVQGKSQGSAPSELYKKTIDPVINDPKNFKRLKQKAKEILQSGSVKPTNNTAADLLLDKYKLDPRELQNFTELDQGVDQIFTDTFLDGLRNRVVAGISRFGEVKEDEQPQPFEEDDEPAPVPYKPISTKKKRKVPKMVEDTPPSSDASLTVEATPPTSNISSTESVTSDSVDLKEEFKRAIKALKREINSAEGKEQAQRLAGEFLEDTVGRGISGYGAYVGLNNIINKLIEKKYITPSTRLADIGTDLLYDTGELTKEERSEKIGQFIYGGEERREERKEERRERDKKKNKQPVKQEQEQEKPQPIPTKGKGIVVPLLDEMIKNVSTPSTGRGTGIGLSPEALAAARSRRGKIVRKVPKIKQPSKATDRAKIEEAISSVLKQEQISTKKNVTTGFEEMGQRLDDINAILESRPELKRIHADVVQQLKDTGFDATRSDIKLNGLGLNKKIVEELIKTIPEQNRDILAPAVRSIAGSGGVNMNNVVAGLVGLGVSLAGNPAIGSAVTPILSGMMNTYGVDLNKYFDIGEILDEPEKEEKEKEEEIKINEDVYDVISGVVEEAQPQASSESKRNYIIDSLLSLPETIKRKISELRRRNPTESPSQILRDVTPDYDVDEDLEAGRQPPLRSAPNNGISESVVQGAGTGALYGGVSSGVSTGSAQGAISGIIPGAIAGGIAGLTSEQLLRRYYRSQGIPMNPELNRKIKALSALPAAGVAAYLGYTPSGKVGDVVGTGVTSGAGITEQKITVDPDVLEKTQAQLEQEKGKIKVWEPKAIVPSTAILDESKQEKYIDDVEFIAFNYIPPTSEGAQGTVDTNPLKYQQLLESNIRYTDAGIYIPYVTWNKINDANNMTPQQLKTKMLGPELPRMKFNTFDNEDTFESVSKWQYVNGENTSVSYLSPYSDFSNVENSWWSNPTSELFTINP